MFFDTLIRFPLTRRLSIGMATLALVTPLASMAQSAGPEALIKQLSNEVIDTVKADKAIQAGDVSRIIDLVDTKVMPNVNFPRMTAAAVGRPWRSATPEQQRRIQEEFKTMLVRTYAGALTEVKNQTVAVKPLRAAATDTEVVVRTEIKGRGEPIQLDYRLEKVGETWKIYDVNVAGIWLTDQYKNSFAQEISAGGLDGLIKRLTEKNKAARGGKAG